MIEKLEDLFYDTFHRDKIEISINDYEEDNIIIYKNENNIPSKHKNIIAEYTCKYDLNKSQIDTISTIINRYIWVAHSDTNQLLIIPYSNLTIEKSIKASAKF